MRRIFANNAALVPLQVGLVVAVIGAAQFHGVALGQGANAGSGPTSLTTQPLGMTGWRRDPVAITTDALGMTGWWPDPVITITTSMLGMAGWRRDPVAITTPALGMTGWRPDPATITTAALGMTGWRLDPITVTTPASGMTGWASPPEHCGAPFVRDGAGEECVCPPGLLPSGDGCIAAGASPPADLRVENDGPDTCAAGKACPFAILVANIGAGPFQGPLVVRNDVNRSDAVLSAAGKGWSCAADTCLRQNATLAPGASEILTVSVQVSADTPTGSRLRQCTELKPPEPGDAPVRFVQLMLNAAGIDAGPADNRMGGRTRGAIATFRSSVGLPNGTDIDEALISALRGSMPADPHPENDRDCAEARVTR